jgi:hypothetical protein
VSSELSKKLCAVCHVPLVIESKKVYRGDPMSMIIGPGSRNQMSTEISTHCPQCGLKYRYGGGVEPPAEKPKKLKAWIVRDRCEEYAKIVFAEKRSEAIMSAIGEWHDTSYIEAKCKRAPQFDNGVPSDEVLVREHGWFWECRKCWGHVTAGDLEEGGGWDKGENEDPICAKCVRKEAMNA